MIFREIEWKNMGFFDRSIRLQKGAFLKFSFWG